MSCFFLLFKLFAVKNVKNLDFDQRLGGAPNAGGNVQHLILSYTFYD